MLSGGVPGGQAGVCVADGVVEGGLLWPRLQWGTADLPQGTPVPSLGGVCPWGPVGSGGGGPPGATSAGQSGEGEEEGEPGSEGL